MAFCIIIIIQTSVTFASTLTLVILDLEGMCIKFYLKQSFNVAIFIVLSSLCEGIVFAVWNTTLLMEQLT